MAAPYIVNAGAPAFRRGKLRVKLVIGVETGREGAWVDVAESVGAISADYASPGRITATIVRTTSNLQHDTETFLASLARQFELNHNGATP